MKCKILILVWKDLLMRKNSYLSTIFEITIPIGLVILAKFLPLQEQEPQDDSFSFKATLGETHCIQRHNIFGNIVYEPSTQFIDALMSKAACYAGYIKSNVKAGNLNGNSSIFSIGVKFEDEFVDGNSDVLNYTLFPTNRAWDHMNILWRSCTFVFPRYSMLSIHNVLELQRAIDVSYLDLKNIPSKEINFRNFDLFARSPNVFLLIVHLSIFGALSLIVAPIVGRMVQEKFTGAKELMLTMGVMRWQLWVAKFVDALLIPALTISAMVLFLYVPLREDSNFLDIPPFIFWLVLMYGLISVIFFLFFTACFFDKPTIAVYLTEIIWAVTFVFGNVIHSYIDVHFSVRYLLCLFPHVSLMEGVSILLRFDNYGKDVKLLENLSEKEGSLCLLSVLVMLSVDIILYAVLIWYLEHVKPGRYGLPLPYNFCFKKYYWFPKRGLPTACRPIIINENFELVESNLDPGVMVKSVSKVYSSSDKSIIQALDNVSLDFLVGEISGVLGHNGAGKTTLFSIITGMIGPSEGKVYINGFDISVDICQARESMGLCPQEDMLFNGLTVLQTLNFYGMVKGLKLAAARKESLDLINKLKLTGVKHTLASNLSGGQKRKLSLGIALIGGSKVLILDEPTSGMDPEVRREIWELLLELRSSRTIILTTHFMEEADALCDRIAILDHGRVKCYGSPMFLKSKFGKGYILNVVVTDEDKHQELKNCVQRFIPSAKWHSKIGRTISFELPSMESDLPNFPGLLNDLEKQRKENKISSFCLNLSTLEDVFLSLRRKNSLVNIGLDMPDSPRYKKLDTPENSNTSRVSDNFLPFYQFWALICKKWIFFRKSYKTFLIYSVLPALLTLLSVTFSDRDAAQMTMNTYGQTRLTYSLDLYPNSLILYSSLQDPQGVDLFRGLAGNSSTVKEAPSVMEAIENVFMDDFYTYARKINFGVDFSTQELVIFHNDFASHMVPVSMNFIHNFLLKSLYKKGAIVTSVDSRFANKDLSLYNSIRSVQKCRIANLPGFSGIQTMFYLLGPLRESVHGAKEIQLMITTSFLYWLSHLVFDALSFLVYLAILYTWIGLYLRDEFFVENAGEILLAMFLWGCGLILIGYVVSKLKKDIAEAFSVNIIFYIAFAFIVGNLISMMILPMTLQYLHPSPILELGFADICSGKRSHFIYLLLCYDTVLFLSLVVMDWGLLSGAFHFTINKLFRVDYNVREEKDELVKEEEEKVQDLISEKEKPILLVNGLSRWFFRRYRPSPAVRGVSFCVSKGECFGILGVNGAGKTSTFEMLAGRLPPSQGSTYACSKRLTFGGRQQYLFSIGYCPQSGGLIPLFSGREILTFIAQLRGMKKSCIKDEVEKWLEKLNLLEYAKEECGTYSGGNKRKLSTAIAVLGGCPLVFLDEPTSGVDPSSRRLIWHIIRNIQKEGQSVVLTSHSMDECEALCSRIAIMVGGKFRCIGETTTLKDRFAPGYSIQLKLSNRASGSDVADLKEKMALTFEHCKLVDEHKTLLQYKVADERIGWAYLFEILAHLKWEYKILESYTASATTLEQIFIDLARKCRQNV